MKLLSTKFYLLMAWITGISTVMLIGLPLNMVWYPISVYCILTTCLVLSCLPSKPVIVKQVEPPHPWMIPPQSVNSGLSGDSGPPGVSANADYSGETNSDNVTSADDQTRRSSEETLASARAHLEQTRENLRRSSEEMRRSAQELRRSLQESNRVMNRSAREAMQQSLQFQNDAIARIMGSSIGSLRMERFTQTTTRSNPVIDTPLPAPVTPKTPPPPKKEDPPEPPRSRGRFDDL